MGFPDYGIQTGDDEDIPDYALDKKYNQNKTNNWCQNHLPVKNH